MGEVGQPKERHLVHQAWHLHRLRSHFLALCASLSCLTIGLLVLVAEVSLVGAMIDILI